MTFQTHAHQKCGKTVLKIPNNLGHLTGRLPSKYLVLTKPVTTLTSTHFLFQITESSLI